MDHRIVQGVGAVPEILLTANGNQGTLHRQIRIQFQGKRHIPFTATSNDDRHGRNTTWNLRAKEAPDFTRRTLYGRVRYPLCGGCRCRPKR